MPYSMQRLKNFGNPANTTTPIFPSVARTASSAYVMNNNIWRGIAFSLQVTAGSGFDITPSIQGYLIGGVWTDILVGASIASVSNAVLIVYPGITAVANISASAPLPNVFRINIAHVDATSVTYTGRLYTFVV